MFDVIEAEPGRVREVTGIGPGRADRIVKRLADQRAIREIMLSLHANGVGTSKAVRIYKTYGQEAIQLITENPYRLARDICGIGFNTADQIASKLGIEKTAMVRVRAGIGYALALAMDEGHCGLPVEDLEKLASELLEVGTDLVAEALADGALPWPAIHMEKALEWVEGRTGLTLAPSQREAVRLALASKVMVITAGPGVGKTTLVNSILKILAAKHVLILLCASDRPRGQAALGEHRDGGQAHQPEACFRPGCRRCGRGRFWPT